MTRVKGFCLLGVAGMASGALKSAEASKDKAPGLSLKGFARLRVLGIAGSAMVEQPSPQH